MSDEDDYMSDSFLAKLPDVRPGLPVPRAAQYQRNRVSRQINQNKAKDVLIEGLNTKLPPTNKGFELLKKMGYKENTGLGIKGTGRVEPVEIILGGKRKGLGHENEKFRKKQHDNELIHKEFKSMTTDKFLAKKLKQNLYSIKATCFQLDNKKWNLSEPLKPGFWPKECIKVQSDENDKSEEEDENYNDHPEDISCSDDEELDEESLFYDVAEYLRRVHFYCFWCGTNYESNEELTEHCPGISEEDHD